MKKIKIVTVALVALFAASCSDSWLDTVPTDAIGSPVAILNFDDIQTAMTGAYDGLQGNSGNITYYGARMIYYGDVRGDDMQARTTGMRTSGCYEMNYTALNVPDMWARPYTVIFRANDVLRALEDPKKTEDASPAEINDVKGQMLTMRALAHFDLVRVYGKPYTMSGAPASYGVPIMDHMYPSSYMPSRNTVEEVYAQVIKDLTTAIPLLPTAKSTGYFNQWAAKALLARVYLYKGDFDNAYTTATEVISNSPYKLWTNAGYVDAWSNAGTSEVIFEIINKSVDDYTDREGLPYLYSEDGYADAIVTKDFVDLLGADPDDVRLKMFHKPTLAAFAGDAFWGQPVFIDKYPGRLDNTPRDMRVNNLPILRLSETYLIASEAALRKSSPDNAKAAEFVNAIALRANPAATAVTAANVSLDRILTERRKELVGEGHRFFDAMRCNKTITRTGGWHLPLVTESESFTNTYFRTILAIPSTEMDSNPNIKGEQNPGY